MSNIEKRQQLETAYAGARARFPEVAEITAEELMQRHPDPDLVLVDVREEAERVVSMIPGAITAARFEQEMDQHTGKTIVPYCTIGGRSGRYSQALAARGWNVLNFRGSILAWTHAGGELVNNEGPTRRVHTHSKRMNLVAEGYEGIW